MTDITTDDLHTIVPAMQPAWLHIAERFDYHDCDDKDWGDAVLPVLAYAVCPSGGGAYLINDKHDGPTWMHAIPQDPSVEIRFSIGTEPKRGVAPSSKFDGYTYCPDAAEIGEPGPCQYIFTPETTP